MGQSNMTIKIFTYKNPYDLTGSPYWEKIKKYPHFCSSQVMVNAMELYYEKEFESLLCPLEDIIKKIYSDWADNTEKWLAQYIDISDLLRIYKGDASIPRELLASFKKNQSSIVEAVRLLIEMGWQQKSDTFSNDPVQIFFFTLFHKLVNSENCNDDFRLNGLTSIGQLKNAIIKECNEKITREKNKANGIFSEIITERIAKFRRILYAIGRYDLSAIVIHGVHQFTPLQLRFISELEALGIDVYFLFNYQEEYQGIYETWFKVYLPFDADIYIDRSSTSYEQIQKNPSNVLGSVYGKIFSEDNVNPSTEFTDYLKIKTDVKFIEFDNITDCADYVSQIYDHAKRINPGNPLSVSSEQFYSLTKGVQDLLRVYYPESSRSPHFLNYPIGQFFLCLYRLWNTERKEINIDWDSLIICINSGFLNSFNSSDLSRIFNVIAPMFENINTYEEFCNRINIFKKYYVQTQKPGSDLEPKLRYISFYCSSLLTYKEIELVEKAVANINDTAALLFSTNDGEKLYFMDHFRKIQELLESKVETIVIEEEQNLVFSLLDRIAEIKINMTGTISDLQQGLYYFLRQKDSENPQWILREFVQIEGDILRSRKQVKNALRDGKEPPTYHFLGLSDQNMTESSSFPWPIDRDYIQHPDFASFMPFQVYYNSLIERSHFYNYALFYGLFFNECNMKISYIRDNGDEKLQPYSVFKILGLIPVNHMKEVTFSYNNNDIQGNNSTYEYQPIVPNHARDFFLCPDKYFYDYCCQSDIIKTNKFLFNYYYQNLLIYFFIKQNAGRQFLNVDRDITLELDRISKKLSKYFPFFSEELDIFDIKNKAKNYIVSRAITNNKVSKMNEHYEIRLLFDKNRYNCDPNNLNNYSEFNKKITVIQNQAGKTLGNIRTITSSEKEDMKKYLTSPGLNPSPGEWCSYCSYKECCLEPYIVELDELDEEA